VFDLNKRNPDGLNRIVRALRGEEIHEEVRSGGHVIDIRHRPVLSADGSVTEVVGLALDVTDRAKAQAELARKEAFVRSIFDSVDTPLAVIDRTGVIVDANEHWLAEVRSGGSDMKDATIGDDYLVFLRAGETDDNHEIAAGIQAVLDHTRPSFSFEFPLERDGDRRWYQLSVQPLRAPDGGAVVGHRDITERTRIEVALEHQALHDVVTDLPNRTLLRDRLRQAILAARRRNTQVALLFIDLDRFKELNDTFGHAAGDKLLVPVGERIRARIREVDTVARAGGDEFLIVLNSLSYSMYLVLSKPMMRRLSARRVLSRMFAVAAVALTPVAIWPLLRQPWWRIGPGAWAGLAAVIIGPTVTAYLLNGWALRHADSSVVAAYSYLQPVFTVFLAAFFLGEVIRPVALASGAMIFGGLYLASR